jgi:hypothetical protein
MVLGNDIEQQQIFDELKKFNSQFVSYPRKSAIIERPYDLEYQASYELLTVSVYN